MEMKDEKHDSTHRKLRVLYALLWLLPLLMAIFGETVGYSFVGLWATGGNAAYVAHSVIILLTMVCVPVALRSFHVCLSKRKPTLSEDEWPAFFFRLSALRLLLLAIPAWLGLPVYYLTLSSTGALCTLIALTASLFCIPPRGVKREKQSLRK